MQYFNVKKEFLNNPFIIGAKKCKHYWSSWCNITLCYDLRVHTLLIWQIIGKNHIIVWIKAKNTNHHFKIGLGKIKLTERRYGIGFFTDLKH